MLNYIWIGLIAIGILVAVGNDIRDEVQNPYRNGEALEATLVIAKNPGPLRNTYEGDLYITAEKYNAFYGKAAASTDVRQPVSIALSAEHGSAILIVPGEDTPILWKEMAKFATSKDKLTGSIVSLVVAEDQKTAALKFVLEPIRFVAGRTTSCSLGWSHWSRRCRRERTAGTGGDTRPGRRPSSGG